MKLSSVFTAVVSGLFLISCSEREDLASAPAVVPEKGAEQTEFAPGVVYVKFSEPVAEMIEAGIEESSSPVSTKSAEVNDVMRMINARSMERIFPYDEECEVRQRKAGLHKWYKVEYDPSVVRTKAVDDLMSLPGVECTDVPVRVKRKEFSSPNDKYFSEQWALYNNGKLLSGFREGADAGVYRVWQEYTMGSSDVIVAIVDGGISMSHPDLAGVVLGGGASGSKNFVNGSYTVTPDNHGTHVAATIGAITNNGEGVAGIAGGSDGKGGVRLVSCQIFMGESSAMLDGDAAAIVWGANRGAVISNNSWGYDPDSNGDGKISDEERNNYKKITCPQAIRDAIDYFNEFAGTDGTGTVQTGPMKGGLVFFAAGNENIDWGVPAHYPGCIAVGAMGPAFERANYSNYGDWVDVCAPGGNQSRFGDSRAMILNAGYDVEKKKDSYYYMQGTSMASPHAAGVAALMLSYLGKQGFTAADLKSKLLDGANSDIMQYHDKHIGPLVDAYASLVYSPEAPANLGSIDARGVRNEIELSFDSVGADDQPVYAYSVFMAESRSLLEGLNPMSPPEGVREIILKSETAKVGMKEHYFIRDLVHEHTYYLRLASRKYQKVYSSLTDIIQVTTPKNNPPVALKAKDILIESLNIRKEYDLNDFFTDSDGDLLTFNVKTSSNKIATCSYVDNVMYLSSAAHGLATVTITATDQAGATAVSKIKVFSRDESKAFDLYPNPVEDILHISAGAYSEFTVSVYTSTGVLLLEPVKLGGSAFEPATVDMSACAPGVYKVKVVAEDEQIYEYNILKK